MTDLVHTIRRRSRQPDGCAHFSDLKLLGKSPAHYLHELEARARSPKRYLNVGTLVHRLVLGKRPGHNIAVWSGKVRNGAKWEQFQADNRGKDIVTLSEWDTASRIADAVLMNPTASAIIRRCSKEVPLKWTDGGIECATSGVDLLDGDDGLVGELKTTKCASPMKFPRDAVNLGYHAQLAMYATGAALSNGMDIDRHVIVAVETAEPFPVVVFELPRHVIDEGRKLVNKWIDLLRYSEENDYWPGYASTVVPFEVPWMLDPLEADDDDGEESVGEQRGADIFEALGAP